MSDILSDYQKWKQQGKDLRAQAKQAMESRFCELLKEAVQIAEELIKVPTPAARRENEKVALAVS